MDFIMTVLLYIMKVEDLKFPKVNKKFSLPPSFPLPISLLSLPLCLLNTVPYVLANYSGGVGFPYICFHYQ